MANLTGNVKDVTNQAPSTVSSITVKAPGVRLGTGNSLIVSSPAEVAFNHATGALSLTGLTGGLSWLVIEGNGWSDTVALSVAEGMTTVVEAVANALGAPGLVDYVQLLNALETAISDVAQDAVEDAAADINWVKRGVAAGEDLDTFTTPGVYTVPLGSTMSSLVNRPLGYVYNGYLVVYVVLNTVFQVLTQNAPRGVESVTRSTTLGVFKPWHPIDGATRAFNYSDYNDAVIEGSYDIDTFAKARDVANRPPVIPSALNLQVLKIGGERLYQRIIGIDPVGVSEKWERRRAADGIWSDWVQRHTDVSKDWVVSRINSGGKALDHVVAVGDSQVGATYAWANKLAGVSDFTVVNRGVGGYTPDEALLVAGAWTTELVQGVTLPPATDTPVTLKKYPVVAKNRTRAWIGVVEGGSVELKYLNESDTFVFRNRGDSSLTLPSGSKWVPSTYGELSDYRRIVWFGGNAIRNGLHPVGKTTLEHVQEAYSQAIETWGTTTVVCGYVPAHGDTAGRDTANELNTWLARAVPTQFLDIRAQLQADAGTILGRSLTTEETRDIADGYLPKAMYQSDLVHLLESVHDHIALIVAGYPHGATPHLAIPATPDPVVSLTGMGSPEGKVTAPVGSTYTDTVATNGAIRWIKATGTGTTGWKVEYGDTGMRNVLASLPSGWQGTAGRFTIRRSGSSVVMSAMNLRAQETGTTVLFPLPAGFRPAADSIGIGRENARAIPTVAYWYSPWNFTITGLEAVNSLVSFSATFLTDDPWPTSLPGTPA